MQFIQDIIANSQWPVLTAFLLGLAVALHPCPLAANIAAMGYIARDVNSRRKVFFNGIYYTIGRVLAYTVLGIIIIAVMRNGMNTLHISDFFSLWGERILGPVLIIIGLYFIFSSRLHKEEHCPHLSTRRHLLHGWGGSLLLGILLALSFCPESAIVYFGILMPMSAQSSIGYSLPIIFSVATAIPTLIMAWGFAYGIGMSGTASLKGKLSKAQHAINGIVGVLFICTGIFCLIF